MTEKLYDRNAYLSEFSARVISCEECGEGYKTVLDKTAFFPEGGGQKGDTGVIDGVLINDTKIQDGKVFHFSEKPIAPGKTVLGKINFERRFAFMQNHTGEHIVSGTVHKLYGFDNVGFHLGEDFVTLDFNGILDRKQLDEIEDTANKKVWQNLAVKACYPDENELSHLAYRSKKEIDGAVRIVEIEDTDLCACCAPHVSRTGEIGIIKLLDFERMRSGIRILMKCGAFALRDYRNKFLNVSGISNLLSAKQEEAAEAVKLLESKLTVSKQENSLLKKRLISALIASADRHNTVFFEEGLDIKELQLFADGLHKTYGGLKAVFSESVGGFSFAFCAEPDVLDDFFVKFKSSFKVKGGGRNGMVQGTVLTDKLQILKFFKGDYIYEKFSV